MKSIPTVLRNSVLSNPSFQDDTLYINNPSFSLSPSSLISIHPPSLHTWSSLSTIKDGWFLNLSAVDIPFNIQYFLQLGENFALPFNNKHRIIFDCIKNVEISTQRMPIDKKIAITNHSIPILNNIISSPIVTSSMDKLLLKMESETRIFVSKHPNIIFTHADKGNVTVALDKDAYWTKWPLYWVT